MARGHNGPRWAFSGSHVASCSQTTGITTISTVNPTFGMAVMEICPISFRVMPMIFTTLSFSSQPHQSRVSPASISSTQRPACHADRFGRCGGVELARELTCSGQTVGCVEPRYDKTTRLRFRAPYYNSNYNGT